MIEGGHKFLLDEETFQKFVNVESKQNKWSVINICLDNLSINQESGSFLREFIFLMYIDCLELKMTYLQVKEYIIIVENIFWSLGQYHDTCSEEDLVGVFISQMAKININFKLYDILLQNKLCDLFFKTFAQHAYTFFLIYGPIIKNMNAVIIEAVETDRVAEETIDT